MLLKNVSLFGDKKDILIEGGVFKKIANELSIENVESIDCDNRAILPAFYNGHNHAAMTLLRGVGEDKELFEWLSEDIWPIEAKMTDEQIYHATKFAILEMIKSGTVFYNDMYFAQEVTMKAVDEMGIRAMISHVQMDMFDKEQTESKVKSTEEFFKLKNPNNKKIIMGLAAHAIYTVSEELLEFSAKYAKENNLYLHIHASETAKEVSDAVEKYGKSPIEKFYELGLLGEKTILAHCVHLSDNDIKLIKETKTKIAHCPVSNLKLNSGQMQTQKLLEEGVDIVLSTDGPTSNNSLSMIDEMKIAALSGKNQSNNVKSLKAQSVFNMATVNGAKAFGINAGKIEEGFEADFMLVDANHYLMIPCHDLISNMIYSANDSVITDVVCGGKFLMRNKYVKNEAEIIENMKKTIKSLF